VVRRSASPSISNETLGNQHWYKVDVGAPLHQRLVPYGRTLLANASPAHSKNRARERIYEGLELLNARSAVQSLESAGVSVARLNATKSIIDTFVSRLSKDRPMPSFNVDDSDWELKRRAKKYRRFIVGKMLETDFDDLSRDGLLDGAILGNAFTRIDDGENDVFAERVPVNEMLFDDRECRYAKPQQAIRVHRIARDYLAELFPDAKDEIRRAPDSIRRADDANFERAAFGDLHDYVDAWEGWYLPSTPDSANGRHGLCLETGTLASEEWKEPRFPWAMLRLFKPRLGLMGYGIVDQLASLQHRVNCIVRDLQLNIAATGRGHFLVNESNDIPTEMLTGWQPFKLKYKGGQPPQYVAPTPFNPAQLNALEFFIKQMFDLSGVSQAAATSKSSLGAGASGIALDTQYDIDSDRFRMPQANYARYRLDGAQRFIDAACRVARRRESEKGKKRSYVSVSWKNRDAIERLDYDEVSMKEEQYCLQIEPVNFLPDTRAGKLAVVEQLGKAGVIPQWLIPTLFDEPDLQQANGMLLAAFNNAMRKMDDLADESLPIPMPEKYNDLELELKVATAYYNRVQNEKAPLEIQDRFRQYVDFVVDAIKQKDPSAGMPPSAVPPPGAPMAPPEAPLPGGVPAMPNGPVPLPTPIGGPLPPMPQ
jgi:hypothetical protein